MLLEILCEKYSYLFHTWVIPFLIKKNNMFVLKNSKFVQKHMPCLDSGQEKDKKKIV